MNVQRWLLGIIFVMIQLVHADYSAMHTENKIVAVIGTGYVGLVTGAGLAEFGNTVICVDINHEKIDALHNGIMPIYEPGLDELVARNVLLRRLSFTHDINYALSIADVIFIAVGTPMDEDGTADLRAVMAVAKSIACNNKKYQVIVTKSTVPIGTGEKIRLFLLANGLSQDCFDMVSNPEFLREGSAIGDFLEPDRIVIGAESLRPIEIVCSLYKSLINNNRPYVLTNLASAEMIKYASNAFLACKISFINEVANLCDKTGADVKTVAYAMGLDHRISPQFLNPGPGFGGSCFPKDTQALLLIGQQNNVNFFTVQAALDANNYQHRVPVEKLLHLMSVERLDGKNIAVLGAAFKANTDDIRYSPACTVMQALLDHGATVRCYDPVAMPHAASILENVLFANDPYEAIHDADGLIIMTEWNEFKQLDWERIARSMHKKIVVDARNIVDPEQLRKFDFTFDMIGLSYQCAKEAVAKRLLPFYNMISI